MVSTVYAGVSILLLEYGCFSCQHDSFQHVTRKFLDWPPDNKTVVILETSAKESLGVHEWKQHKPWFDEEFLGFWIKGSGLKCSGYRIQAKAM